MNIIHRFLLASCAIFVLPHGGRADSPLPPIPQPATSFGAALTDGWLYIYGGNTGKAHEFNRECVTGDDGDGARAKWHDTLLTLDLRAPEKGWQTQPQPFQRRAIAAVAQGGRLWFIGGMDSHDEPSRAVDWFDPSANTWGKGPDLPDGSMAGFGIAACVQGGKLCVSPLSGKIFALDTEGKQWVETTKLNAPRFFHRLLPLEDGRLVAVGGSNRKGHVTEVELVSLDGKTATPAVAEPPAGKSADSKQPTERGGTAWSQWRGPARDGVSIETGWRKDWSEPPRKLWSAQVGTGICSPVVADGRLITQGNDSNGTDTIFAFDAATGAELWRFSLPCKSDAHEMPIVPNGPGATPTICGGLVFALTREGDLVCLDVSTGQLAWRKNLVTDLGGKRPVYGYTQSPLVAEGRIFLDVGAEPGKATSTVALDAATGQLKWQTGMGEAGYSSARLFERDGQRFVAMLKGEALDVFDPADGRIIWSYRTTGRDFTNSLTPVFVGHRILVSNTTEAFARLLDWDLGAEPNVRVAWQQQQFALLFNNPILKDGALFAFNEKRRGHTEFTCVDAQTGEARWVSDTVPIGTFILADGHWIFLTREGEVVLVPASATELKPIGRFKAFEDKCYATPALANSRLYVRSNGGELVAYDLKAASTSAAR